MKRVAFFRWYVITLLLFTTLFAIVSSCTKKKIIIYKNVTDRVTLASPPNTDLTYVSFPQLTWEHVAEADSYQVNITNDPTFLDIVVDAIMACFTGESGLKTAIISGATGRMPGCGRSGSMTIPIT